MFLILLKTLSLFLNRHPCLRSLLLLLLLAGHLLLFRIGTQFLCLRSIIKNKGTTHTSTHSHTYTGVADSPIRKRGVVWEGGQHDDDVFFIVLALRPFQSSMFMLYMPSEDPKAKSRVQAKNTTPRWPSTTQYAHAKPPTTPRPWLSVFFFI